MKVLGAGPPSCLVLAAGDEEGRRAGITHFGFRLLKPADIDAAIRAVERAGGTLLRRGEFGPGLPFAFFQDPHGYEIEVWYE